MIISRRYIFLLQLGLKFPKAFECSMTQFASLPSSATILHYTPAYSCIMQVILNHRMKILPKSSLNPKHLSFGLQRVPFLCSWNLNLLIKIQQEMHRPLDTRFFLFKKPLHHKKHLLLESKTFSYTRAFLLKKNFVWEVTVKLQSLSEKYRVALDQFHLHLLQMSKFLCF